MEELIRQIKIKLHNKNIYTEEEVEKDLKILEKEEKEN